MNCQKIKEVIYTYMDGELEKDLSNQVKEHLLQCSLCALAFEKEEKFNSLIKNHVDREEAPYELREAIVDQLEKVKRPKIFMDLLVLKPLWRPALVGMIMVFLLVVINLQANKTFPLFSEAIASHMDYLKGSYPVEIKTNDMQEVIQWFKGKTDFAVRQPHISTVKAKLIGGRIVHIKDRKAAYFIFEKDGHTISAFAMDLDDVNLPKVDKENVKEYPNVTVMVSSKKGFQSILCLHKVDKSGCLFVSDLPVSEIKELLI